MKILLTGFEPFNGDKINPSQLIVNKVEAPLGISLIREILPVEFKKTSLRIRELLEEHMPDVVISIGQAGNRVGISVERVAINLNNVRSSNGKKELPDNAGETPIDQIIEEDGETAYFTNLPVWEIVKAIQDKGIEASASYTAGTYVCNHVMYTELYEVSKNYPNMKAGFIHVPFLPEQIGEKEGRNATHAMELSKMVEGVEAALEVCKEIC